jgi:hypothetical protein
MKAEPNEILECTQCGAAYWPPVGWQLGPGCPFCFATVGIPISLPEYAQRRARLEDMADTLH